MDWWVGKKPDVGWVKEKKRKKHGLAIKGGETARNQGQGDKS